MLKTPVLIAGGGPAGLILSLDLSRRGIKHILLNDRPAPAMMPKLDVINTRSMEIFRALGVKDAVRASGLPTNRPTRSTFKPTLQDEPILTLGPDFGNGGLIPYASVDDFYRNIRNHNDGTLPVETNAIISQMYLEPVLKTCAEEHLEADVRFGHELIDFKEHADKVTANVRNVESGEVYAVEADYLVACDGAQSLVRKGLNIRLDGYENVGEMTSFFIESRAVAETDPLGPAWHAWTVNPNMLATIISLNLKANYFNVHTFGRNESAQETLEIIFGGPFEYKLIRQTPWTINIMVAESYGTERVFLAGDAAHQFFPTYGLGCNTAALDTTNLGWKLAAVLDGWASPQLLQTYKSEMRALAQDRRDYSARGAEICRTWHSRARPEVMDPSEAGDAARKELADVIAAIHPALYGSLGLELGFRYAASDVVVPDGSSEPASDDIRYLPTTWPGSRLPHVFLVDGTSIFDRLGLGFTLITFDDASDADAASFAAAARTREVPLAHMKIAEPWIEKLYERRMILVRPDQHVAWRGDAAPANVGELFDRLTGKAS